MIPTTEKCCFCISLRTGAIVIGVYLFVSGVLSTFIPLRTLQFLGKEFNEDEENERQRTFMVVYSLSSLTFLILLAIAGMCIVIATCWYLPMLLKYSTLFYLAYSIGRYVFNWFLLILNRDFFNIIMETLNFVFCLYLVVVLWSYYKEMLEDEDEEEEEEDDEDDY